MSVIKSLVIAFSMYSKIPMPHLELEEKDMRYVMGFFPLAGLVIGAVIYGWVYISGLLNVPDISRTLVLVVIPVLITGGIHIDGYMDTSDALNSYGDREKKLDILKDSHIIVQKPDNMRLLLLALTFYLSRIISGLAAVNFRGARNNGMLHTFTSATAVKCVNVMLAVQLIICVILMCLCSVTGAVVVIVVAFVVLLYYRYMAYKQFGGVTGDLAGYLLCVSELCMTIAVAVIALL